MLKATSIVVCESEEEDVFEKGLDVKEKFEIIKVAKYGAAHVTVLAVRKED
jgi:16S rRNA G966 N2-methylase RsmD